MLGLQIVQQAQRRTQGHDTPSEDEDEPRKQSTGEQKKFPPEVKTVNALHMIKGRNKAAPLEEHAPGPITAELRHWSSQPITFDHRDYSASIQHAGWAALVLDPIIDEYHFTRVPMDGGSSLNLLYQDTVRKMGINPSRIKPTRTTFKGVIPGLEARCTGSITLEVVFGSPDNFRSEELIFDIVPFLSGYHALLGRTAFARFNAVPHYAYLKFKMPGPRGVITINGNMERSLRTEEHTMALAAEIQRGPFQQNLSSAAKPPDTIKRVRTILQQDSPARQEHN